MAHSFRARTVSLVVLTAAALVPFALSLGACGGGGEQPPAMPTAPSASAPPPAASSAAAEPTASASAAASETASAPPPPPPAPTSTVAAVKTDAAWSGCHQSYVAKNKDVAKDVAAMAKGCSAATKMKLDGKPITGKQADQDKPQSYPLAAKANHCYRVYGQAAEGIKDLDVAVKDSAGVIVAQDSTDDPSPVVAEDGAVCFSKDDGASVVVSVGMGSGAYALQIWSN